MMLKRQSGKQQKFWKYLSGNLSYPRRLVIELSFDKSLVNEFGDKWFVKKILSIENKYKQK